MAFQRSFGVLLSLLLTIVVLATIADAQARPPINVPLVAAMSGGSALSAEAIERGLSPDDILAPVGTANAYDAMHLLAMAIDKAEVALENLGEYRGLIKTHKRPFTPGSTTP